MGGRARVECGGAPGFAHAGRSLEWQIVEDCARGCFRRRADRQLARIRPDVARAHKRGMDSRIICLAIL